MNSWLIISSATAVLSAIVLIWMFRWDERLDRSVDPDYHWLHTGTDRAYSVIKLTVRLQMLGVCFATVSLLIWNGVAPGLGRAPVPILYTAFAPATLAANAAFFKVALSWLAVLFFVYAGRCLATPLYDIFISYKSEDVMLARRIADALCAAGWRVWFAEYQVLLHRRERFQLAIEKGILNSRFGLALTNNRWAQSEHCDFEIKLLLKSHGPGEILELRLPSEELPHRHNPALAGSPFLKVDDVGQIISFVEATTGRRVQAAPPIPVPSDGRRYEANAGGRSCSLLVEGWTLHESGRASDQSLNGLTFRYEGAELGKLFVNIYSGPEVTREGQRLDQRINDRKMYDLLVAWAPKHVNRVMAKVRGVHLLFHSGLSQMALTYWIRVVGYWTRKVSIVIPNRATGHSAEFVFTFGFRGTFAEYSSYTHVMDAFALSLEWN